MSSNLQMERAISPFPSPDQLRKEIRSEQHYYKELECREMEQCQKSAGNSCDHAHHEEVTDEIIRAQDRLSHIQHKLLVMSGKGGVGKSSVATYLAIGLGRLGYRVGLLDVDFHGPSIPRMLGISGMFRFNEQAKALVPHDYSDHVKVVSMQMKVHFLGSLPFDPRVVEASDLGHILAERENGSAFTFALAHFVSDVIHRSEALAEKPRPKI